MSISSNESNTTFCKCYHSIGDVKNAMYTNFYCISKSRTVFVKLWFWPVEKSYQTNWNLFFVLLKNLVKKIFGVTFEKYTPKTCWRLICFHPNYCRKKSDSKNIFSSKKLRFFMFLFLMLLKNLVEKSKKNIFETHVLNTPYSVNLKC